MVVNIATWSHFKWWPENPWFKHTAFCIGLPVHCWDYRRFVVAGSKQQPEDELKVSQQLIEHNLSNYSAWHYRSKLLPLVYPPPPTSPHPVAEQALIKVHHSTPLTVKLIQRILELVLEGFNKLQSFFPYTLECILLNKIFTTWLLNVVVLSSVVECVLYCRSCRWWWKQCSLIPQTRVLGSSCDGWSASMRRDPGNPSIVMVRSSWSSPQMNSGCRGCFFVVTSADELKIQTSQLHPYRASKEDTTEVWQSA